MKKKVSIKSDQPVASKSNVTVPKSIEPARSSGPVDDHKAETASNDGGASPSASDEPLPKDRAAYLLGFYAQIPFVDAIIDPLLAVCDGLPTTKVMLLDNCLSRIAAYDEELAGVPDDATSYRWRHYSPEEERRLHSLSQLRRFDADKLRAISSSLWSGRSELRSWYLAGVAVGEFAVQLNGLTTKDTSALENCQRSADRACAAFRRAAEWSFESTAIQDSVSHLLRLLTDAPIGGVKTSSGEWDQITARIGDTKSRCPHIKESVKDEMAQFIYEHILISKNYGKELLTMVNEARELRTWPQVTNPEKLVEIARQYAKRNNKPFPSERVGGRKPDSEE